MKKQKGFTLLIAIITTSMLLIVSFVVVNVALKQLIIADANEQSQYAFYAADAGTECAVYWDLDDSSQSEFATSTSGSIMCNGQTISGTSQSIPSPSGPYSGRIGGGGNQNPTSVFYLEFNQGCAIVSVTKMNDGTTNIDSRGYNRCDWSTNPNARRFERGVTLSY